MLVKMAQCAMKVFLVKLFAIVVHIIKAKTLTLKKRRRTLIKQAFVLHSDYYTKFCEPGISGLTPCLAEKKPTFFATSLDLNSNILVPLTSLGPEEGPISSTCFP